MPLRASDKEKSTKSTALSSKSPWRHGYHVNKDRFAATVAPQELCQDCYDAIRSIAPNISRVVQIPGKKLRCAKCKKVYSDGRKGRG